MEARVMHADTLRDVPSGGQGELWVHGDVVTPGYFKDPKATSDMFAEPGWFRTGDLVLRDEYDRIHCLERLKEMIKVKGLQAAATKVEITLLGHPEGLVRDACVVRVEKERKDGSLFLRAWVVVMDERAK
jgi:4-coumarate--CoA ligase